MRVKFAAGLLVQWIVVMLVVCCLKPMDSMSWTRVIWSSVDMLLVVVAVELIMTWERFVAALHGCTAALCDKIKQSADGTIQGVIEIVVKRGNELSESDVSRITQSLFSVVSHVIEKAPLILYYDSDEQSEPVNFLDVLLHCSGDTVAQLAFPETVRTSAGGVQCGYPCRWQ